MEKQDEFPARGVLRVMPENFTDRPAPEFLELFGQLARDDDIKIGAEYLGDFSQEFFQLIRSDEETQRGRMIRIGRPFGLQGFQLAQALRLFFRREVFE